MLENVEISTDNGKTFQPLEVVDAASLLNFHGEYTFIKKEGNDYIFRNDYEEIIITSEDRLNLIVGKKYKLRNQE